MAYINGKEILFSPNINITVGENYVLSEEDIEKIAQLLLENLTIDTKLDTNSTNPVQNKIITAEINQIKSLLNETSRVHFTKEPLPSVITSLLMEIQYDPDFDNKYRKGDFIFLEDAEYADYVVVDVTGTYTGENVIEITTIDDISKLAVVGNTAGKIYKIGNKITIATIDFGELAELVTRTALNGILGSYMSKSEVKTLLNNKQDKTKSTPFYNGNTITVEDNTIYTTTDTINNLTILYPTGNFICSFIFTVGDMSLSTSKISFPTDVSKYIGKAPDFQNGETWEINIMNGYVTSGKVVSE